MTARRWLIETPATIVDRTTAAVLWLDEQATFAVVLLSYAYWITVATVMILAAVVIALWLALDGTVPPVILPRGPRA